MIELIINVKDEYKDTENCILKLLDNKSITICGGGKYRVLVKLDTTNYSIHELKEFLGNNFQINLKMELKK